MILLMRYAEFVSDLWFSSAFVLSYIIIITMMMMMIIIIITIVVVVVVVVYYHYHHYYYYYRYYYFCVLFPLMASFGCFLLSYVCNEF